MRIASLVPSATETLFALGLGERVVAVTHECDYPPQAVELPHVTRSVIPEGLEPAEIDSRVRELVGAGKAIYELDREALAALEPDLVVTQAVCQVCAVAVDEVRELAASLPGAPEVISLDPTRLEHVVADFERLGAAAGAAEAGRGLAALTRERVERVRELTAAAAPRDVLALEWLDPPFAAGHWIGELVEAAGGRELLGAIGERSRAVEWPEVEACAAEVIVSMPCGLDARQSARYTLDRRGRLVATGARECVAVDAAASFSRPGPRLADGAELLGHLLNPDLVADPRTIGWARLWP